jgi:hypothetical protein
MVLSYLGLERAEADDISQILGTKKYGTPSFAIERLSDPDFKVLDYPIRLRITCLICL